MFTFKTNLNALNYKIINIDLSKPEPVSLKLSMKSFINHTDLLQSEMYKLAGGLVFLYLFFFCCIYYCPSLMIKIQCTVHSECQATNQYNPLPVLLSDRGPATEFHSFSSLILSFLVIQSIGLASCLIVTASKASDKSGSANGTDRRYCDFKDFLCV